MQRTISGYHLLTMLSVIDNTQNAGDDIKLRSWLMKEMPDSITEQDKIIRDWLTLQFVGVNLDPEMEKLMQLKADEYDKHFQWHTDNFYRHSTHTERISLLKFAMDLIKLDGKITREEHHFFDLLYDAWTDNSEL
jgi:hypothetical protein